MDLKFTKTKTGWPLKAQFEDSDLIFSGVFDKNRINQEARSSSLGHYVEILLWLIMALGLIALACSLKEGWQTRSWSILFLPSQYNLIFWVSGFTTAYLWARKKQKQLDQQAVNLLHWTDSQKTNGKKIQSTLNIYELFNEEAKQAWNGSLGLAEARQKTALRLSKSATSNGPAQVYIVDLFRSLLELKSVNLVFLRLGIDARDIKTILANYSILALKDDLAVLDKIPFLAFAESLKLHNKTIDPLMLLCALAMELPEEHIIQAIFLNVDLSVEKLEILSSWIFNLEILKGDLRLFHRLAKFKPDSEINKGLTAVPTPYLHRFSEDLTWAAKHAGLPIALGRQADLNKIFQLLKDRETNLLIKGAEGSGRTTLINELAYKMAAEQVPKSLADKRLVRLETSEILGNPQKAENVLVQILNEAARSGNIVLVVEEIHSLSRIAGGSGMSLLELLVDFLQNHNLTIIATTTIENATDYLHTAAGFEQTFTSYELPPLNRTGILLACCVRASLLETKNSCLFRYQAIEQAVDLTDVYVKDIGQPQKAIAILVEASSRVKNSKTRVVTAELVQKIISEKTHIPTQSFNDNEADKLLHLEETLAKYIIGQKTAITAVAEGLRRARSGLASAARPLASFLFLGPTGVGKTEVAKTLAATYFGEEKYLLRLDMSEYQNAEELIKTGSSLVKHIKNYPFCLLLLDEFEKASPQIHNLFLQILDDGRLTTTTGEVLDLTHCLIIATSNAGSREIQAGLKSGQNLELIRQTLFNQLLIRLFPPELLNRFDGIVLFSPLSRTEVEQVAILQLQTLKNQLLQKGIKMEFGPNVVQDIAKNAYDPSLGARPIRRYIQDHLESFIAKLILGKKISRGSAATIDLEQGAFIIK